MGALDSDDPWSPTLDGAEASAVDSPKRAVALALLEVIDRDDHVRQAWTVREWPLTVGRDLTNDVALSDPHVAAHHFSIAAEAGELVLRVGVTVNGITFAGGHRLHADALAQLPRDREAIDLVAGRTRLRLRLAHAPLAPEVPLGVVTVRHLRLAPTLMLATLLLCGLAFNTYLESDPDTFIRILGNTLLAATAGAAIWCTAWALLSKTITRQGHFGWHLRVFVSASLALLALAAVPGLIAFSLSWPWLTDFSFVAIFAVGAAALYFHLLAVEPARPRLVRWTIVLGAIVGAALTVWFNLQRSSRMGDELYMSHLFPPSLRLARPLATDRFIEGLTPLHALLDKKSKEPAGADDGAAAAENDDDE